MTYIPSLNRRLYLGILVAGLAFGPAAAVAQTDSLERARHHMENGQDLFVQHQYADAAAQFMQAYEIEAYGAFLFNAAVSWERAMNLEEAISAFRRYVEADPRPRDADAVLERIAALEARLASQIAAQAAETPPCETEPCAEAGDGGVGGDAGVGADAGVPSGETGPVPEMPEQQQIRSMISVRTEPEGAAITLMQGEEVVGEGAAPFAESVEEGAYTLRVDHPDYEASETSIQVRAGQVYVVVVNLSQGEFLGYLRVLSEPPGARVFINNREEGSPGVTPYAATLPVGEHRVWVERPGYETIESAVTIGLGEHLRHEVNLERVSYGRLRVLGNIPGSEVFVNDQRVGQVPWEGDLPAGEHEVRVSADGQKDWEEMVEIFPGQRTPVRVRLLPAVPRGSAWTTLLIGLAVAGAGGYFAYETDRIESELAADRAAGVLASDDPRIDRGFYYSLAANGGFGLGGLMGLMSMYLFIRDPLPDSEGFILEPLDWGYEDEEEEDPSPDSEGASEDEVGAIFLDPRYLHLGGSF